MFSLSPLDRSKVYECTASVLHAAFKGVQDDFSSISAQKMSVLVAAVAAAVEAAASRACADFKEKWNGLNPDRMMRLPVELTSTCFRMLSTRDRYTISHVSRAWRRAALADPLLWTDLRILFSKPYSTDKLETLLPRSHPAPFRLCAGERRRLGDLHDVFAGIMDFLPQHIGRMQSFRLRCDHGNLRNALARLCGRPVPLLRKVTIENQPDDPVILPGPWGAHLAPQLQHLSVGAFLVPPKFVPVPTVSEFRGDLRPRSSSVPRDFGLHNLFNIFPGLTSLSLSKITAVDLFALPALPPTLTDIWFDPRQGLVDFTSFVDDGMPASDAARRFEARCVKHIPATVDAFARKARGPWSLSINPYNLAHVGVCTCEQDDGGLSFELSTFTAQWWVGEPMMSRLERLASLTLPWAALLHLASPDTTLPSLQRLTLAGGSGATLQACFSAAATPLRAPHLETLAFERNHLASPSDSADYWASLPAAVPLLVSHAAPQIASARFEVAPSTKLGGDTLEALVCLARHVVLEEEYSGVVLAEFLDGERVSGPQPRPPSSDDGWDEYDEDEDEW